MAHSRGPIPNEIRIPCRTSGVSDILICHRQTDAPANCANHFPTFERLDLKLQGQGCIRTEEGGRGVCDPKFCTPKMAQQDFPNGKFRFPPPWSLGLQGGRGAGVGGGGTSSYGRQRFQYIVAPGSAACGRSIAMMDSRGSRPPCCNTLPHCLATVGQPPDGTRRRGPTRPLVSSALSGWHSGPGSSRNSNASLLTPRPMGYPQKWTQATTWGAVCCRSGVEL